MEIYYHTTVGSLFKSRTDYGEVFGSACMVYMGYGAPICLLDWKVTAKTEGFRQGRLGDQAMTINEECGVLIHARSRSAMQRGLRKVFDMHGNDPQYTLSTGNQKNITIAFSEYDKSISTTRLGAAAKIVYFNIKQLTARGVGKILMELKTLQVDAKQAYQGSENIPFPEFKRKHEIKKFGSKVSGALGMDRFQSLSNVKNANLPFCTGFVVYVGPSEFFMRQGDGDNLKAFMGHTINMGQIATWI
jgi:hypothetical protein